MTDELKPCPACGALPCDWVDNPHPSTPPAEPVIRGRQLAQTSHVHHEAIQIDERGIITPLKSATPDDLREAVEEIAEMMGEFVDNWPEHEKLSTSIALIAKTLRASRDEVAVLRAAIKNPPKHRFWGAGEPDCPKDIKAGNGELHTLRCKVCGEDSPRDQICRAFIERETHK